jgi:hypothetical protein
VWVGILRRALMSVGIDAVPATAHEHALGQLQSESFDLVTLDMSLDPDKRFFWGRHLLAVLKTEDVRCPPIIVVSATRDFEHVVLCLNEYRDRVRYFTAKEPWHELGFLTAAKQLAGEGASRRPVPDTADGAPLNGALTRIRRIVDRFHIVAQALGGTRGGLSKSLADERDVQRVLGALLALEFDDVRPEDPVPTVAGAASRVDFIIPALGLVIETKMTRPGLTSKKLGEELIVDITRYRGHPECKFLFCFVYDPEAMIDNPRGIEGDLTKYTPDSLGLEVAIRPRTA